MGPFQTEARKTVWKPTLPASQPHVTRAPALEEAKQTSAAPLREKPQDHPAALAAYLNLKLGLTPWMWGTWVGDHPGLPGPRTEKLVSIPFAEKKS